jgi:hypothetical protein
MADSHDTPQGASPSNFIPDIRCEDYVRGTRERLVHLCSETQNLVCYYHVYHLAMSAVPYKSSDLSPETREGLSKLRQWLRNQHDKLLAECASAADWAENLNVKS